LECRFMHPVWSAKAHNVLLYGGQIHPWASRRNYRNWEKLLLMGFRILQLWIQLAVQCLSNPKEPVLFRYRHSKTVIGLHNTGNVMIPLSSSLWPKKNCWPTAYKQAAMFHKVYIVYCHRTPLAPDPKELLRRLPQALDRRLKFPRTILQQPSLVEAYSCRLEVLGHTMYGDPDDAQSWTRT